MAYDEALAATIRDALAGRGGHRRAQDVRRPLLHARRQHALRHLSDGGMYRVGKDREAEALALPQSRR